MVVFVAYVELKLLRVAIILSRIPAGAAGGQAVALSGFEPETPGGMLVGSKGVEPACGSRCGADAFAADEAGGLPLTYNAKSGTRVRERLFDARSWTRTSNLSGINRPLILLSCLRL